MHTSHGGGLCNHSLPCLVSHPAEAFQGGGEGGMHVPHLNFKRSIEEEVIRMWL